MSDSGSSSSSKAESVRELISKTNHTLLDVRCRSLRSLSFKLQNGLVEASELAKNKDFLTHLLEWFNFDDWALEGQVLTLLNQLSEHSSAANMLVEVGGVEFLSQLRQYSDPLHHPIIDDTIEHLLNLQVAIDSAHMATPTSSASAVSDRTLTVVTSDCTRSDHTHTDKSSTTAVANSLSTVTPPAPGDGQTHPPSATSTTSSAATELRELLPLESQGLLAEADETQKAQMATNVFMSRYTSNIPGFSLDRHLTSLPICDQSPFTVSSSYAPSSSAVEPQSALGELLKAGFVQGPVPKKYALPPPDRGEELVASSLSTTDDEQLGEGGAMDDRLGVGGAMDDLLREGGAMNDRLREGDAMNRLRVGDAMNWLREGDAMDDRLRERNVRFEGGNAMDDQLREMNVMDDQLGVGDARDDRLMGNAMDDRLGEKNVMDDPFGGGNAMDNRLRERNVMDDRFGGGNAMNDRLRVGNAMDDRFGGGESSSSSHFTQSWRSLPPRGFEFNEDLHVDSDLLYGSSMALPTVPRGWGAGIEGSAAARDLRSTGGGDTQLTMGHFSWLTLTANDLHILTTTENRLADPSPESLQRSCEFLQDVLFQDFPPELFLQRPSLVHQLVQLLVSKDASPSHYPYLICLLTYARKLLHRVKVRDSPSSTISNHLVPPGTAYNDLPPTSSDPALRPQTTGDGGECGCGEGGGVGVDKKGEEFESITPEQLILLQSNQLTPRQFCSTLMTYVTPLVISYLDRNFPWVNTPVTTSPDPRGRGRGEERSVQVMLPCRTVAVCISVCLQLVECGVGLMECEATPSLLHQQEDGGMQRPLQLCVASLCSALSHCLSKWRRMSQTTGASPQMQLVCCVTLDLAQYLSRLLRLSEEGWTDPISKQAVVPTLIEVLQGLMMNPILGVMCPEMQESVLQVFTDIDSSSIKLYHRVKSMSASFEWMSLFLASVEAPPTATPPSEERTLKMLHQASGGLPGLWFANNKRFTTSAVNLCLACMSSSECSNKVKLKSKEILLKLLCHGNKKTKKAAYILFTDYLEDHLPSPSVLLNSSVLEPPSTATSSDQGVPPSSPALFLSVPSVTPPKRVWQQILLAEGVLAVVLKEGSVCETSTKVVLRSMRLMTEVLSLREELDWPEVRQILIPLLPYLEVGVVEDRQLYDEFKALLSSPNKGVQLPVVTQLHSLLRLLYSDSSEVREWAYSQLPRVWEELGEGVALPSTPAIPFHDVLIEGKSSKVAAHTITGGTFQQEDVVRLLSIFSSDEVDHAYKQSALEQLAIVLRDKGLHEGALKEGLIDHLLCILKTTIDLNQEGQGIGVLEACLDSLLVLVLGGGSAVATLRYMPIFFITVFTACIYRFGHNEVMFSLSKLLALLLFKEELSVSADGRTIYISKPLKFRLKFPFQTCVSDVESSHATPSPVEPSLIAAEPCLSMLKLQYLNYLFPDTIICHRNQDNLGPRLQITEDQLASLCCLNFKETLTDSLSNLTFAGSHRNVAETLQHVSVLCYTVHSLARGGEKWKEVWFPKIIGHLWKTVVDRFLKVRPCTPLDYNLLESILYFLSDILSLPRPPAESALPELVGREELLWLCEVGFGGESVPRQLLVHSSLHALNIAMEQNKRSIQKAILQFFGALLRRLTDHSAPVSAQDFDFAPLIMTLSQCLDITGSPSYYDIPLLQLSLECLLHLTDRHVLGGVSGRGMLGLSMKLMTLLRQVLWSFMSGQGKMANTFMGKGVISRASLALSHLIHITDTQLHPPQEWWLQWLQSSGMDLVWLKLLVKDRVPGIRYAGLSLVSTLLLKPGVATPLLEMWASSHPLSLWGTCVNLALEPHECSLVRKQAIQVLVNLSAVCYREKKWDTYLTYTSKETNETMSGKEALGWILDTYKFFEVVQYMVKSEALQQSSHRIAALLKKIVSKRELLQCLVPLSEYKSQNLLEKSGDRIDPEKRVEHLENALKGELCDVFVLCEPHVVSGICQLLYNLCLAFPAAMATEFHRHAVVVQLASLLNPIASGAFLFAHSTGKISIDIKGHDVHAFMTFSFPLLTAVRIYKAAGIDTAHAKASFEAMDKNAYGIVSKEEFLSFNKLPLRINSSIMYGPLD